MAALHSFVLQTPQSGGFVSAVDHSEGLKANLEEEGRCCRTSTSCSPARCTAACFPVGDLGFGELEHHQLILVLQ